MSFTTTNSNEQAPRSINQDGIELTLLGDVMQRMQYDFHVMSSLSLQQSHGIYGRNQEATDYRRAQMSITWQGIGNLNSCPTSLTIQLSGCSMPCCQQISSKEAIQKMKSCGLMNYDSVWPPHQENVKWT